MREEPHKKRRNEENIRKKTNFYYEVRDFDILIEVFFTNKIPEKQLKNCLFLLSFGNSVCDKKKLKFQLNPKFYRTPLIYHRSSMKFQYISDSICNSYWHERIIFFPTI